MEQSVVDVSGLSRSFGDKTALDGVSFRATAGQVYGLVGSNGAGKTTLLKHVYLLWSGFAEHALTGRYVCGTLVISAAFGAAWVMALQGAGMQFGGMLATEVVWIVSPVLLPLMASVLSPWSLNRIRHT